jgi:hypothetical protein
MLHDPAQPFGGEGVAARLEITYSEPVLHINLCCGGLGSLNVTLLLTSEESAERRDAERRQNDTSQCPYDKSEA